VWSSSSRACRLFSVGSHPSRPLGAACVSVWEVTGKRCSLSFLFFFCARSWSPPPLRLSAWAPHRRALSLPVRPSDTHRTSRCVVLLKDWGGNAGVDALGAAQLGRREEQGPRVWRGKTRRRRAVRGGGGPSRPRAPLPLYPTSSSDTAHVVEGVAGYSLGVG